MNKTQALIKKPVRISLIIAVVIIVGFVFFSIMNTNTGYDNEQPALSYVGLTEEEARNKAKREDKLFRIISKDGDGVTRLKAGDDKGDKRVNVTIENDIVTNAELY